MKLLVILLFLLCYACNKPSLFIKTVQTPDQPYLTYFYDNFNSYNQVLIVRSGTNPDIWQYALNNNLTNFVNESESFVIILELPENTNTETAFNKLHSIITYLNTAGVNINNIRLASVILKNNNPYSIRIYKGMLK